ncbi:hypothetical protein [Pedobacter cryoconitis]|uniref:Uncharacterized protein n=1 Tax=Pedobacter cryoconitis TaxID=188932 RepID=A0A327RU53_9SPHI|nr:hypothetical protein [Pedobacter cryoconitis]RAJ19093.1 hypothetical protein LY11_05326 [Pedobacter cryoconitis]
MHLNRFWEKSLLKREGKIIVDEPKGKWRFDKILMNTFGLGLEQTFVVGFLLFLKNK